VKKAAEEKRLHHHTFSAGTKLKNLKLHRLKRKRTCEGKIALEERGNSSTLREMQGHQKKAKGLQTRDAELGQLQKSLLTGG